MPSIADPSWCSMHERALPGSKGLGGAARRRRAARAAAHHPRRERAAPLLRMRETSLATLGFSATLSTFMGMLEAASCYPRSHAAFEFAVHAAAYGMLRQVYPQRSDAFKDQFRSQQRQLATISG